MSGSKFPVFPALLIPVIGFVLSGCGGGGGGGGSGSSSFSSLGNVPIDALASTTFLGRLELSQDATPFTEGDSQSGGASGAIGEDPVNEETEFTASGEIILGIEDTDPLVESSLRVVHTPPADETQEEPDAEIAIMPRGGNGILFTQYARLGDDGDGGEEQDNDGPDGADAEAHINLIGDDDLNNIGVIADLEHQAFGVWVQDFGGSRTPGAANFSETPPPDVSNFPSGTAEYEGGALGVLREGQARHFTAAELNANVNFNTNKYEITTSGTHRVELREGAEAIPDSDLDFRATGDVSGASLEIGEADGRTSDYIGQLQGKLLGTGAEEIGGIFRLDNDQGAIYTGSFGARHTGTTP